MKKIISLIIAIVFVLNIGIVSLAKESQNIERAKTNLLNAGWTLEEIDDLLTEEALLSYSNVKRSFGSEKYYKVTETLISNVAKHDRFTYLTTNQNSKYKTQIQELSKEDFMNQIKLSKAKNNLSSSVMTKATGEEVITSDGYMKLKVDTYDLGGKYYQLSFRYEWVIPPKNTKVDIFGLGHCDGLTQDSSYDTYYVYKATYDYLDMWGQVSLPNQEYETYSPEGINEDVGGTVCKVNLLNDRSISGDPYKAGIRITNHRGYIHYRANVNNSQQTHVSIFGDYFHQESTISVSPSISYPFVPGISFSNSNKFKEMSPNPYFSWNVN